MLLCSVFLRCICMLDLTDSILINRLSVKSHLDIIIRTREAYSIVHM